MPADMLQITDQRTGKQYQVSVQDETIRAIDLRQIKVEDDDFGLMTYDPGYTNTACCRSEITFIDGAKGILRYRGYPIEQLAGRVSYMQTAWLILHGELPTAEELEAWTSGLKSEMCVHASVRRLLETFHYDANPMHMLMSAVAALGSYHPESGEISDPANRRLQIDRLIAQMPLIAAYAYRHKQGLDPIAPDPELSYCGNFLNMFFGGPGVSVHPVLVEALDVLFVLHADHEQNCSAAAMRGVGSSQPDPYMSASAAIAALAGPLHGGANAAVLRMLRTIGSVERIPEYVERAKAGEFRLMGFGHRVYKNYDPRARIIKKTAEDVLAVTGTSPLLEIAQELEKIALQDEYFVNRKLYPNVDFYSGLIYQAMGFPTEFFTVLFAIGRTVGWMAQWEELMNDSEFKIARPRQIYTGPEERPLPGSA